MIITLATFPAAILAYGKIVAGKVELAGETRLMIICLHAATELTNQFDQVVMCSLLAYYLLQST